MSNADPDQSDRGDDARSPWVAVFRGRLPLETETSWYLLLSVLDVLFTYILLTRRGEGGMRFYESNPVARMVLGLYGVKGIIVFKFVLVAVVCFIAQLVATRRPRTAKYLMWFAMAAVGGVVAYSAYLLSLAFLG